MDNQNNAGVPVPLGDPGLPKLKQAQFIPGIIKPWMLAVQQQAAVGDTYYSNGESFITLGIGNAGQVLTVANGVPTWTTPASGGGSVMAEQSTTSGSSTTSNAMAAVTNGSISITIAVTSNILLIGNASSYSNGAGNTAYSTQWHDGTALLGNEISQYLPTSNARMVFANFTKILNKAPGTYTYNLRHRSQDNATSCTMEVVNLIAIAEKV